MMEVMKMVVVDIKMMMVVDIKMMVVVKPEYPNCDSAAFGRHDAPEVEQQRLIVNMCRVMMVMMRLVMVMMVRLVMIAVIIMMKMMIKS